VVAGRARGTGRGLGMLRPASEVPGGRLSRGLQQTLGNNPAAVPAAAAFSTRRAASASDTAAQLDAALHEGNARCEAGDLAGALSAYAQALLLPAVAEGQAPMRAELCYHMGNCLYALKRVPEALEAWQRCLNTLPPGPPGDGNPHILAASAHVNSANVYALQLRDYPAAFRHYQAALALDPGDGEATFNYACSLDAAGNLDQAIALYDRARKLGIAVAEKHQRNALVRAAAAGAGGAGGAEPSAEQPDRAAARGE
jgi:tetratricopeptide (TPR) repeat protein